MLFSLWSSFTAEEQSPQWVCRLSASILLPAIELIRICLCMHSICAWFKWFIHYGSRQVTETACKHAREHLQTASSGGARIASQLATRLTIEMKESGWNCILLLLLLRHFGHQHVFFRVLRADFSTTTEFKQRPADMKMSAIHSFFDFNGIRYNGNGHGIPPYRSSISGREKFDAIH